MAGNCNSGRKKHTHAKGEAQNIIKENAPAAAGYLRDVANGKEKPDSNRIDVCKYLINQAIGMPKQRNENENTGEVKITVEYKQGDRRLENDSLSSKPEE